MTPEEGLQKQIEIYRGMTPYQRLQIAYDLCEMTRDFARAGIRHQNPDWGETEIENEVRRRVRIARDGIGSRHCGAN
jgi:hypothetical protein